MILHTLGSMRELSWIRLVPAIVCLALSAGTVHEIHAQPQRGTNRSETSPEP